MSEQDHFSVLSDGRVIDTSVVAATSRITADLPGSDAISIEAHLSFVRAQATLGRVLGSVYATLGLTVPRYALLRLIHHSDVNRLNMTEIGSRMSISNATVSRLVDGLERDGWVARESSTEDKRQTFVALTAAGRQKFLQVQPQVVRAWEDLWAGLSPDERKLLSHLSARLRMSLLSQKFHVPKQMLE